MTDNMKTVIPYTHGKGKTGAATTGADRVLIKPTEHYPAAFEKWKQLVREAEEGYKKLYPSEEVPPIQKQLLNIVNKFTGHVNELTLPSGEDVIFLNLDSFRGKDFNYLRSVKVDNQRIFI